jgi:dihydroorotase
MNILLTAAKIVDSTSPYHLQTVDVWLHNGKIAAIGQNLQGNAATIKQNCQGLSLSTGWVDMGAVCGEVGNEYREDFVSLAKAAQKGGFTQVGVLPNTNPVVQSKESIAFIRSKSSENVTFLPIAAASLDLKGEDLTEVLDLYKAGAVAFSDGLLSITNTAMLHKALLYLQHTGAVLINRPDDKHLTKWGVMHEGNAAVHLGLKGMPSIAEHLGIQKDLKMLEYTGGKLHFSCISTAESVKMIAEAKAKGLAVTCDIAAYQLSFLDEDLYGFDTNLKVKPPFRTATDRQALLNGLADGTIDAVISAHCPLDIEAKELEFDLADYGIIGLETAFASLWSATHHQLSITQVIDKLTVAPRKILQLPNISIQENSPIDLTLFSETTQWTFSQKDIVSKSKNTPFVGKTLTGKVMRTFKE